jgi:hypothetical protein
MKHGQESLQYYPVAGVSKSFRTGRLERELEMVQFFDTRCSCIAILWVTLVSFAAITLCLASQQVFVVVVVDFVIDSVRKLLNTLSITNKTYQLGKVVLLYVIGMPGYRINWDTSSFYSVSPYDWSDVKFKYITTTSFQILAYKYSWSFTTTFDVRQPLKWFSSLNSLRISWPETQYLVTQGVQKRRNPRNKMELGKLLKMVAITFFTYVQKEPRCVVLYDFPKRTFVAEK